MKLTSCRCGMEHLERIERSWWMRLLFPGRRLYYCSACRSKRLIRKVMVARHDGPRWELGNRTPATSARAASSKNVAASGISRQRPRAVEEGGQRWSMSKPSENWRKNSLRIRK